MQVQWIGPEMFAELGAAAHDAPRRRVNRNFHAQAANPLQRMLNVMTPGSYVTPHRHEAVDETLLALDGQAGVFLFDAAGAVIAARRLDRAGGTMGVDIPAGVWHSVVALSPVAVLFEVKPGPYDPATAKVFAPWAPAEGDPGAADYLGGLIRRLA